MLTKDVARRISASLDLAESTSAKLFKSVGRKKVSAKKVKASAKRLANIGRMAEDKIIASMNGKSDILKASGIKAIENLHSRALAIQAQSKLILKANEEYLEDEVIEEDEFDGLEDGTTEVEDEDEFDDLEDEDETIEAEEDEDIEIEDEIVESRKKANKAKSVEDEDDDAIGEEDIFEDETIEAEEDEDIEIEDEIVESRKKANKAKSVRAKSATKKVNASKSGAHPYGKGFWTFGGMTGRRK